MAGYREPMEDAQFFKLSEPSTYLPPENSHVVSRSTVRVIPQTGSEYTSNGNRVVRIVLPSTGMLDTQNSYFMFGFNNDTTGVWKPTPNPNMPENALPPTYGHVNEDAFPVGGAKTNISALFQRMRILIGGSVVEDINAYNLIANMLFRCGRTGGGVDQKSEVSWIEAYSTASQAHSNLYRNKYYQFAHRPMCGLLNNLRYIPLAYIGELTIEITLEDPKVVYFDNRKNVDITKENYKYSINQFVYNADILQFDGEYVRAFEEAMITRGVHLPFDTFAHYKSTTANPGDVVINHRGRNVKNIFALMCEDVTVNSPDYCSLVPTWCGLTSYQLRIGAFLKPLLPVVVDRQHKAESFLEFLKSLTGFNRISAADVDVTADQWAAPAKKIGKEAALAYDDNAYFVIGIDLEREGQIASGLDTASEATPITLALTQDPYWNRDLCLPDYKSTHIDTFVHSAATLIISSPHEVTLFT